MRFANLGEGTLHLGKPLRLGEAFDYVEACFYGLFGVSSVARFVIVLAFFGVIV